MACWLGATLSSVGHVKLPHCARTPRCCQTHRATHAWKSGWPAASQLTVSRPVQASLPRRGSSGEAQLLLHPPRSVELRSSSLLSRSLSATTMASSSSTLRWDSCSGWRRRAGGGGGEQGVEAGNRCSMLLCPRRGRGVERPPAASPVNVIRARRAPSIRVGGRRVVAQLSCNEHSDSPYAVVQVSARTAR